MGGGLFLFLLVIRVTWVYLIKSWVTLYWSFVNFIIWFSHNFKLLFNFFILTTVTSLLVNLLLICSKLMASSITVCAYMPQNDIMECKNHCVPYTSLYERWFLSYREAFLEKNTTNLLKFGVWLEHCPYNCKRDNNRLASLSALQNISTS